MVTERSVAREARSPEFAPIFERSAEELPDIVRGRLGTEAGPA